jgi:hypothetical protein
LYTHVEDVDHVGVLDGGRYARFPQEALVPLTVLSEAVDQYF